MMARRHVTLSDSSRRSCQSRSRARWSVKRMKVWVLGSGSEGNAVLVESGRAVCLVDCGFGTRTLLVRLKTIGIAPRRSRRAS
jgi:hypothetical protein